VENQKRRKKKRTPKGKLNGGALGVANKGRKEGGKGRAREHKFPLTCTGRAVLVRTEEMGRT